MEKLDYKFVDYIRKQLEGEAVINGRMYGATFIIEAAILTKKYYNLRNILSVSIFAEKQKAKDIADKFILETKEIRKKLL